MSDGWTLQELIGSRFDIRAYCDNPDCRHHQLLDLPALRNRLGPDVPAMAYDLKPKLRCTKCGGRAIS